MEKTKEADSRVQQDRFWTWRVNREENRVIQEINQVQERVDNQKRLQTSIEKAKEVASRIKNRNCTNSIERSPN